LGLGCPVVVAQCRTLRGAQLPGTTGRVRLPGDSGQCVWGDDPRNVRCRRVHRLDADLLYRRFRIWSRSRASRVSGGQESVLGAGHRDTNVVLATPTVNGKSLVAGCRTLLRDGRPGCAGRSNGDIKALAQRVSSSPWTALFGSDNVGMVKGRPPSVNVATTPDPVCCARGDPL